MPIKTEYLIIIPKEASFCDSIDTFNRLLQVDSGISIKKGSLTFDGDLTCDFHIASGEVSNKEQRFFHLRLTLNTPTETAEGNTEKLSALLKRIRTILSKAGGIIETLWDDISFTYSKEAYAQIHEVESLMRKLIANFMLVTVGKEWLNETSPTEIQEAISKSKRKDYVNVLHTIDFIHLADFLIKPYSKKPIQELYSKISNAQSKEALDELLEYVPKSNWQRYFSKLVNCEDSYLNKRWSELYELRCKVAHNAIVTKSDRDKIAELSSDLKAKLEDALLKLPQVSVPREEQELVAESAAINISARIGEFILAWRLVEEQINRAADTLGTATFPIMKVLGQLRNKGLIDSSTHQRAMFLNEFRNRVVHGQTINISEADLRLKMEEALILADTLAVAVTPH